MTRFILKISAFCAVMIILMGWVFWQADGKTDPFYLRFTTPRQTSFILGTSRAAQGLQPCILNPALNRNDIFNFAMTVGHSPYGPTYYRQICEKLQPNAQDGIYILAVTPFGLSSKNPNPNDTSTFRESRGKFSQLRTINRNPNLEYLITCYNRPFAEIITFDDPVVELHKDGWLEIKIDTSAAHLQQRKKIKMDNYNSIVSKYHPSEVREQYLTKTINKLKQHGEVFLVRLPVSTEMMALEDAHFTDFTERINCISRETETHYIDLTDMPNLLFTDGNHLERHAGKKVSQKLAEEIQSFQNRD